MMYSFAYIAPRGPRRASDPDLPLRGLCNQRSSGTRRGRPPSARARRRTPRTGRVRVCLRAVHPENSIRSHGSPQASVEVRQRRPRTGSNPVDSGPERHELGEKAQLCAGLEHVHRRESRTQRPRSTLLSRGRLTARLRTPSWCRSARISTASWRRVLTNASAAESQDRMRFSTAGKPAPARVQSQ